MSEFESLLSSTMNEKPIEFNDTFQNLMIDKLHNAINNRKIEVAHNMFRTVREPEDLDLEQEAEE